MTTVTNNVFHHVACTYNGTSVKVYVDGNLEASTAYSDGIGLNNEPVRIGYDTSVSGGARWFKGLVDEARIFHRALCPSEIMAVFQAGSQGQCKDGTIGNTSCDDGNACTTNDTCSAGACVGGPPPNCNDNNVCTNDSCTPVEGCVHANNTSPCNDGNACTQTDACQAGSCTGANPVICTALDQCHVPGTCNTSDGICSNPNKADGSSCNDGDACSQTDTCEAGSCTGANPVICTALDQCHVPGTCNTSDGICSNPNKADGSTCNDGTACTTSDACLSGACVGGPPPLEVCNVFDDDCDGTVDEGCVGKTTGGGEIAVPGGMANFGFVAQRQAIGDDAKGQLEYYNHARGLNVHGTSILTLMVTGNTSTFTGECTKNQAPCTFSATVEDNGEPGRDVDRFTIAVSGEPLEGTPDPITRGNIQIHPPPIGLALQLDSVQLDSAELDSGVGQTTNALAGAGGGTFPGGTSFNGVSLTGLRFGTGVDVPGDGSANGTHSTSLLGLSGLGLPQTVTVEVTATTGYVTIAEDVYLWGVSTVDMGDGTPPQTGVPFSLVIATDAQGQGTFAMVIDTTSLPVATINLGSLTPPASCPPPEIGATLAFTTSAALSWSALPAAASYNLYRGTIGGGPWTYGHACFAPALTNPGATDGAVPSLGQSFYYLASGQNACGEGTLGARSDGQTRPNASPCP